MARPDRQSKGSTIYVSLRSSQERKTLVLWCFFLLLIISASILLAKRFKPHIITKSINDNETDYSLYDAPGRTTAKEYPVPHDDEVQTISRNLFATRTENKEVLVDKFQQREIKIVHGKASKESIIMLSAIRKSTHSYSSENRFGHPLNKIILPDPSVHNDPKSIPTLLKMTSALVGIN